MGCGLLVMMGNTLLENGGNVAFRGGKETVHNDGNWFNYVSIFRYHTTTSYLFLKGKKN